jgi:hypothetical protein
MFWILFCLHWNLVEIFFRFFFWVEILLGFEVKCCRRVGIEFSFLFSLNFYFFWWVGEGGVVFA